MSDGTNGPVLVQGIKPDDTAKPPTRLEIRDMIKNKPDQWNLYLLGLERFQNSVPEDMPLSYFQIAGIHGLPYTKWPNRDWNKMVPVSGRNDFGGFCTHSSILFLSWHRPYLALFEAELYKHVNAVAHDFTESERKADFVKAAKTFRMPYWDWARPDVPIFPAEAGYNANNQVTRPKKGGKDVISPNPLASYKFRESASDGNINWFSDVDATVRFPAQASDSPDERTMKQRLAAFFQGQDRTPKGRNLTERIVYILQSYNDFGGASNNRFNTQTKTPGFENWGSFEDIHNAIHTYVGGNGQMGFPSVSAFDPIFWLHHTNIDRIFAIWQTIHDDPKVAATYVTDQVANQSNFSTKSGSTESINTPLTPFTRSGTKEKQDFWTSGGARSTKTFGYVYPETQDWIFPKREDVLKELNRLYQRSSFASIMSSAGAEFNASVEVLQARAADHIKAAATATDDSSQDQTLTIASPKLPDIAVQAADATVQVPMVRAAKALNSVIQKQDSANDAAKVNGAHKASSTNGSGRENGTSSTSWHPSGEDRDLKKLIYNNKYLEWLVNIKAEKSELGGNYIVHVFLGDPDDAAPILYITNHSHVAAFATFGQDENTACQNCQDGRAAGLCVTGQIPLTLALVERYLAGIVDSLRPEHVIPYLQKNLHWRVTLPGGQRRSRRVLNNLIVSVVTNEVTIPANPQSLPQYADIVIPRPDATTNREGGSRGRGTGYIGGQLV